jgi:hypothetical protein
MSLPAIRTVSIDTHPYITIALNKLNCINNLIHDGIDLKRSIVDTIHNMVIAPR